MMLRKKDCIEALEEWLKIFREIEDEAHGVRHYTRCCEIVWFLGKMGVLTGHEEWEWIDRFADASATAWCRIRARRER